MKAIFPDNSVSHAARRRVSAVLAGALAALALSTGVALAQGGGTAPPPTEPSPAPVPTTGRWIFPIPAEHTYGDGFGAGRGHQGQDIFAPCGTPLISASPGPVLFRGFHRRAGYYVVTLDKKVRRNYVYMHLAYPSLVGKKQKLRTGQMIGAVGETGNARGCHLHFEIWRKPGWYRGGRPINPLRTLLGWDAFS